MADENGSAGNPAATPASADAPRAGTEPAQPSHRDWNQVAANMRAISDAQKGLPDAVAGAVAKALAALLPQAAAPAKDAAPPPAAPAAAPAPTQGDEVRVLRTELAVRDALSEHGVTSRAVAERIAKLAVLEAPPDIGAWVNEQVNTFGFKKPVAPAATTPEAAAPPPQRPPVSNTGAAAAAQAPIIPSNPWDVPKDVWDAMSWKERDELAKKHQASLGAGNPVAAIKRALGKK